LTIPKSRRPTAFLIANEWENQDKVLKNHALPMVCTYPIPIPLFACVERLENRADPLSSAPFPFPCSGQTSLASRAIDALTTTPTATSSLSSTAASDSSPIALSKATKTKSEVVEALLKYFDTDTICFHEDKPRGLVKLQTERWDPLLDWAREKFGVEGESGRISVLRS
jgi:ATP synthase F1 complex assembly factor 2